MSELIDKSNNKNTITDRFLVNGKPVDNPKDISHEFCKYFSNIGINLNKQIKVPSHSFNHYLGAHFPESFFIYPTDHHEVLNIINSIKSKQSSGVDGLNSIFIKGIANNIVKPICIAINASLNQGFFPDILKTSKVVPIYKSKSKELFTNYRPVSLLPILSKIIEKIMHKRLYHFLTTKNILYNSQYGFRHNHSTTMAVMELVNKILLGFENNNSTLAVFLDLSKAFDTIDHSILLHKLAYYGIRGTALEWFKSYLYNRRQSVCYKGVQSENMDIHCGVPQGSVLGPLLFILYTNDFSKCLVNAEALIFADDTTISLTNKDTNTLYEDMTSELLNMSDWFKANKLSLNLSKTNHVFFSKQYQENLPVLKCEHNVIENKKVVNFLGLKIDNCLNWSEHCKYLVTKLSSANYILNAVKHNIDTKSKTLIYHSLFHCHLNYGVVL